MESKIYSVQTKLILCFQELGIHKKKIIGTKFLFTHADCLVII